MGEGFQPRELTITRIEELLKTVPTSSCLIEPPDTNLHFRWCGRRADIPSPDPNSLPKYAKTVYT